MLFFVSESGVTWEVSRIGVSVALKLHTIVVSTQFGGPLKAARSRKPLGYSVPGETVTRLLWNTLLQLLQCMPHRLRVWSTYLPPPTTSYAVPAPAVFAAPVSVVEHISPAVAVCAAPVSVVEYISTAPAASDGAYSVCRTSSCRGIHFSSCCSVYHSTQAWYSEIVDTEGGLGLTDTMYSPGRVCGWKLSLTISVAVTRTFSRATSIPFAIAFADTCARFLEWRCEVLSRLGA